MLGAEAEATQKRLLAVRRLTDVRIRQEYSYHDLGVFNPPIYPWLEVKCNQDNRKAVAVGKQTAWGCTSIVNKEK